ncbi:uncharacterized protein LOC103717516 [Phoenix dactylifera]|uniref:Uncharacterized protein LOC103717516 n=1 Tax=Phoenix dactylifera TaxID=42345 RepID=A0A8B8JA18_PHODC|nr:uncharacterized protein LOC103717516 [Phoenix dactylifera]XP_026664414.2 uncharacterized protein LOC103717516 [Phoenix dactylifera]
MAFGAKENILYIRRPNYRLFCNHLFIISFFIVILYKFFPTLFALLVTSSPITICTALLLGIILTCGDKKTPKIDEDRKTQIFSSHKTRVFPNVESRRKVKKMTVREAVSHDERATDNNKAKAQNDRYGSYENCMAANSSVKQDKRGAYRDKKVTEERKIHDCGFAKKKEVSAEGLAKGVLKTREDIGSLTTSDQKNSEGLKLEGEKSTLNTRRHSTLREAWDHLDRYDASSSSESDQAECSSPDAASMADIMPMLDELHLLLDSEPPQPALVSKENSDVASIQSSDVGSVEEEAENVEDEDDEEVQDEKDDKTKSVVSWTADDQKNLVELGKSEMERNQRLESLIARRRARKFLEKNLICLDNNDSLPSIEDLSRFQIEIPSVFPPRRNPFDLPHDLDEIPLSAPPRLVPGRNPFDLPLDQAYESNSPPMENLSHQEVVTDPQRDMLLRRHDSFTSGASFLGDLREERRASRLKPFFVAEKKDEEETDFNVPRQSSEGSDSTVISPKSYTIQDPLANHDTSPAERGSQSSEGVDEVDVKQVESKKAKQAVDSHITYPVYDSSSSATEKTN